MNQNTSQPSADDAQVLAPVCSIFRRFLKDQGLRFTTERAMVLDTVLRQESVFEVEELIDEIKAAGHRVSKATVYRTMKHLTESGILKEVLIDSRSARYQLAYGRKPTDHLVNVDTDEVIGFYSTEMVALRDRICREHGLDPVGHQFLIYAVPAERHDGSVFGQGEAD